ncbi:MAG: hypothetical protein ABIG70_14340 [Pseudomonadota bacterium]|nr:hypothetical protein [Gammaproteobacteria bacterium]MBU1730737.1 hypothetical protein [Gammaproteobacteria bacterium]MBU1891283.1 hypothetical protein [Gammaproteobacteria bacterium]
MADSTYTSEIEKNFPRIVEKLTMLWGHDGISAFLSHLLIDDRGDRQGFTGETMAEIMFLNNLHEDMERDKAPQSGQAIWENSLIKNLKN